MGERISYSPGDYLHKALLFFLFLSFCLYLIPLVNPIPHLIFWTFEAVNERKKSVVTPLFRIQRNQPFRRNSRDGYSVLHAKNIFWILILKKKSWQDITRVNWKYLLHDWLVYNRPCHITMVIFQFLSLIKKATLSLSDTLQLLERDPIIYIHTHTPSSSNKPSF